MAEIPMIDPDNSSSHAADILVLGGIVVTMDERRTILPDGALALRGNSILAIGPRAQIAKDYSAATIVDAAGSLVIPGLIDAHTHIPMTLFRGLADDLPLHTWLEQHVWPAEHRFINPETVRWASRLGVAELLRSGVTTLCDMYFYENEVATVVDELGMRGVLANAHFDVTTATNTDRERSLAEAEQFVARWRGHSRIVPALGPHAPYTVSPELYRRLHALAERLDTLVVTHLAETQEEDSNIRRLYGRSPVRHLANLGLVDARLVAAHCVWVDGEEIDLLARARTGVVHNPRSNLKLASGIAPVPDMLRAGVLVALGTDGAASNNALDLLAEIQMAALLHKGVRLDPLAVPAASALEMATIGGARALKLDHLVGSLEAGKRADLVIIDLDEDNLVPLYDPVSHLAYAVEAADVRTVIVDGRIVLRDGVLTTADEQEIRRQVRALASAIGSFRGQVPK
jgi:5-methylthioadenosine/S-adenosylhomocysteine deaminase